MAVITKKEEKVARVVAGLDAPFTFDQFKSAFIAAYPRDWERINQAYKAHQAAAKPGKSHPMPKPDIYLQNALNVHQLRRR